MIEIIPAILARDEAEFRAKFAKLKPLGLAVHVDVMDGAFVPETSWAPADGVRNIIDGHPYDVHLMVSNPEHAVPTWLACGARTVIFHVESTPRHAMICRATAERCKDVSLAINPETAIAASADAFGDISQAMLMGVHPGRSGQTLDPSVLAKIAELKELKPSLRIMVDGGARPENVRAMAEAGADAVVAGSAIVDQDDPAAALAAFREALS